LENEEKEIIINNNFTSISFGVIFWLILHLFIAYSIFFSGIIDWSVDEPWYEIIKGEMEKSFRFSGILTGLIITNIMAVNTLYKTIKKPKKIRLNQEGIFCDKSFNDLLEINFDDIEDIKKSYYTLHLTGYNEVDIKYLILSIIAMPLVLFFNISTNFSKIICFQKISFYIRNSFYLILFSKTTNRVINIPINNQEEYNQLKKYFLQYLNINLDTVKTNFKLSNIKEEN